MKKSDQTHGKEKFWFIVDNDRKVFEIRGPLADDTRLSARIAELNREHDGRWTLSSDEANFAVTAVSNVKSQFKGFRHVMSATADQLEDFDWS